MSTCAAGVRHSCDLDDELAPRARWMFTAAGHPRTQPTLFRLSRDR